MAKKYVDKLTDRRVLVFGSTSGIGLAIAEASLAFGAHVFITGSNQSKLDKAITSLNEAYPESAAKIKGATLDLSNGESLEADITALLQQATNQKQNPLHHVVICSGDMLDPISLDTVTVDQITAPMHVRQTTPFILAKLLKNGGFVSQETPTEASFTLTAGTMLHKPLPGWTVLASLLMNLEALRKGLAIEMSPHVRVNVVTPGAIDTEFLRTRFKGHEAMLDTMLSGTLTKSLAGPEEVVEAYLFLMRCWYITGEEIIVDGGRSLGQS